MGLLEKIINKQIQEEEKTFTKAELQSLLRRAEHILSGSDSDNTEADKKKKIDNFSLAIKNFKKKKNTLSVPLEIFNIFTEYFDVKKGSLLILNQSSEYFTAWALAGYDNTTANRLRIPAKSAENIFSENSRSLILKNNSLKKFSKYFSSREFATLNSLFLIPFFTDKKTLFAFLLFSHNDEKNISDILNNYDLFYPVFNNFLFYFFNNIKLKSNSIAFVQHSNLYSIIDEEIKKSGYSNPFILFFDINKFLKSISDIIDKNFQTNFYNNLIDLFSSFVSNNGNIYIIDNNTVAILKDAPSLNDKDMIAYQISFFIKNIIPKNTTYPGDQEIISNLIKVFHLSEENDILKQFLND